MNAKKITNPAGARELTTKELKDVVGGGGKVKEIPGGVKRVARAKTIPGQPRHVPGI